MPPLSRRIQCLRVNLFEVDDRAVTHRQVKTNRRLAVPRSLAYFFGGMRCVEMPWAASAAS